MSDDLRSHEVHSVPRAALLRPCPLPRPLAALRCPAAADGSAGARERKEREAEEGERARERARAERRSRAWRAAQVLSLLIISSNLQFLRCLGQTARPRRRPMSWSATRSRRCRAARAVRCLFFFGAFSSSLAACYYCRLADWPPHAAALLSFSVLSAQLTPPRCYPQPPRFCLGPLSPAVLSRFVVPAGLIISLTDFTCDHSTCSLISSFCGHSVETAVHAAAVWPPPGHHRH